MNINSRIVCILTVLTLLISISVPSVSSLVEKKSLKDLIKESDNILTGKVTDKRSYLEEGKIFTDVTILSDMNIKGDSGSQYTLKILGGTIGDVHEDIPDVPLFEKEEDVLLFLRGNEVVGLNQGKYTIKDGNIKENGKSLAEFVHNIKKEGNIKKEKGGVGRDIDVAISKFDMSSAVQIKVNNSSDNVTMKSSPNSELETIKFEGFEYVFPNDWLLYGSPTWCDTNYRSASGSWSGWPSCEGPGRVNAGTRYPNYASSSMVFGPFSLVDATDAFVKFTHWTDTEPGYDFFSCLASTDGVYFYGSSISGDWTPWKDGTFDLKNVNYLGDLRGQPKVWIAFSFDSDYAIQDYGTFLDNIRVLKDTEAGNSIVITSPNGGETWVRGTSNRITWNAVGTFANVKIELLKSGSVVGTVAPSAPNFGFYSWTISPTRALGPDYKIKITSTSDLSVTDTSYGSFAIGGINVNSPNGGENWARGTPHTITWNKLGNSGPNVRIDLLKNGLVVGTVTSSTPNDGSYSWTISTGRATGTDYKIRVMSTSNAAYKDTSNNNFRIS